MPPIDITRAASAFEKPVPDPVSSQPNHMPINNDIRTSQTHYVIIRI